MTTLHKFTLTPKRVAIAGALALAVPGALALPTATAVAQTDRFDQAIAALRGIETMKADFVQTDRTGQSVRGTMTLKRPGRIRFEYQGGDMLVVSNGRSLTFVDYEVDQVQRWPIRSTPLGALLDPGRDVKQYGRLVPTSNPDVTSVEVKDTKNGVTITMIFVRDASAPGGWRLSNWVALDAQNKRTRVDLSNQRYGMSVPDSAFTFRDPRRSGGRP